MIKAGGGSIVNGLLANPILVRPKWAQYVATKAGGAGPYARPRHALCPPQLDLPRPDDHVLPYRESGGARQYVTSGSRASHAPGRCAELLQRCGEPHELAYSISLQACDESSSVTGANFMIDGVSA